MQNFLKIKENIIFFHFTAVFLHLPLDKMKKIIYNNDVVLT